MKKSWKKCWLNMFDDFIKIKLEEPFEIELDDWIEIELDDWIEIELEPFEPIHFELLELPDLNLEPLNFDFEDLELNL